MHVITKARLIEFWEKHPDAKNSLDGWYRLVRKGAFTDFNNLRATFPSADLVGVFTVFNIGGNKYRLIAAVHYNRGKVYIREVLTYAEYDRGDWKRGS